MVEAVEAQQEHAAPVKSSMNGNFCVYLLVDVWYDLRIGGVPMKTKRLVSLLLLLVVALSLTACTDSRTYEEGYEEGYEAGYDSGYDEGRAVGYDEGSEGWPLNDYEDGYDVGFEMGYEAAEQDAIDSVLDDPIYYLGEDVILDLAEGLQETEADADTFFDDLHEQAQEFDQTVQPTPEPTPQPTPEPQTSVTVYVTNTGEKYHRWGCQYLWNSSIAVTLDYALASGYTPCSRCNPPRG